MENTGNHAAKVHRGDGPIILAMPHVGTNVPREIEQRLNAEGRKLRDTDWFVDRLYDGLLPDSTVVKATFHRYVIDANRDPEQKSLYPGQNTTELVPQVTFDNEPIWETGGEPAARDIAERLEAFHRPYHEALAVEIERVKREHGMVLVYDCHSIRSVVPFLFEGTLPDFNLGTDHGKTCNKAFETAAVDVCRDAPGFTHVLNGRFRGGWTTRHYGRPHEGLHTIQMELAQKNYLASEAPPFEYDPARAERLRDHLRAVLDRLQAIATSMSSARR
ncbi:MAG: N-formylglutamate deformylase [Polyangiaceae bacterium]